MNRENFIKNFSTEDFSFAGKIADDISLAISIEYVVFSKIFYPPHIWSKLLEQEKFLGIKILTFGLNNNCEKKLLGITPKDFDLESFNTPEDLVFFKINGANKFKELQHKDFLGSIMNLGLKRESFGDFIVKDNICYGVTTAEYFKILNSNLEYANKIPVTITEVFSNEIPQNDFKEIVITVPSLRVDSIVSELFNISRVEAVNKLEIGEVYLNYNIIKNKSSELKLKDTITIRKKGKFIFEDNLGENKKGKLKLKFLQWV